MKPGNLHLQGAKSGGGNRKMRERMFVTRPRRARFLFAIYRKGLFEYGYEKKNFYV